MIYNPKNNALIADVETYLQKQGVKVWYDFRVFIDDEGKVWFYKGHILYVCDFKKRETSKMVLPAWSGCIIGISCNRGQASIVTQKAIYQSSASMAKLHPSFWAHTPIVFQYDMALVDRSQKGDVWVYSKGKLFTYFSKDRVWKERKEVVPDVPALFRLPNDHLCVATSTTGILVYDGNGKFVRQLYQSLPVLNGLVSNHIQSLYYDAQTHAIVVGYNKHGMTFFLADSYDLGEHRVQWNTNMFRVEDVISFAPADGNSVWMGTEDNGIYRVRTDGTDQILENKFPKLAATAVLQDAKGKVWVGAYRKGLLCSDGRQFLQGESPYKIMEIGAHRFIVLLNGKGLMAFNPENGKTIPIPTENPWVMDVARAGRFLYAATPDGLYRIDVRTLKQVVVPASVFKNSSFGNGNRTLLADSRGLVWLVSHKGRSFVDVYDTKARCTFQVSQLKDYDISSLREDKHGHIWCATDRGLVLLKVKPRKSGGRCFYSFELYCYGKKNTSMFNYRAMMNLGANRLLVGTTQGFLLVDVQRLEKSISKKVESQQLVISSLRINGNYVSPGKVMNGRVLAQSDLPFLKELHLKSNENNIMLECFPKDLFSNGQSLYAYQLEGASKEWIPIENHFINLSNLLPGKYRLLVREQDVNHGGYQPRTLLLIEIASPFWKSSWAYFCYVLLSLMGSFLVYKYYRKRQESRRKLQAMRLAAEQEKKLNEMKLRFFTNISHDLRTPLTLIITPVEDMMNTVKDRSLRHVLGIVYHNAKQLFRLVNQILDFRKLENGATSLNLSYGDMVGFVKEVLQEYSLFAQEQKLSLSFETDADKLEMAFDKGKVEKVIHNLLSNAIKYTPAGGKVGVRLSHTESLLCLECWDTGIGISDEDKPHVFERFYMNGSQNGKFESSGIGLNIVKDFVELWHGRVEVLDNHPQGTIFRVTIPIMDGPVDGQLSREESETTTSQLPIVKTQAKVLLVEDNADLLDYLSRMLSREYEVYQATDGKQALDVIKGTDVDIVISDVMMNGMDGLQLCKHLKGDINTSHIPIILLTAKAMTQDEVEGLSLGASDYLTKPFNLDILRLRIRSILERISQARTKINEEDEINPSEVTVTTLDEQLLADVIRIVEENMGDTNFNVEELSEKLCMHRTNLYKKMQFISGKSPAQFIRMMRLKRGKQLLSRGNVLISQVAYQVGFNDPKKFAKYFKEEFGMYPSEYAKSMSKVDRKS